MYIDSLLKDYDICSAIINSVLLFVLFESIFSSILELSPGPFKLQVHLNSSQEQSTTLTD